MGDVDVADVASAPAVEIVAEGNIGELLHSPSAAFMKLVDCDHLNDFDAVCDYLSEHTSEVSYKLRAIYSGERWRRRPSL